MNDVMNLDEYFGRVGFRGAPAPDPAIVARTTPDARHALLDNRLTVRRPGGDLERRTLSADQIERALEETFLLPVEPDWRQLVESAAALPAAADRVAS